MNLVGIVIIIGCGEPMVYAHYAHSSLLRMETNMKNPKYELVAVENWEELGLLPYRIRALQDIRDPQSFRVTVFKGTCGGYVEHPHNLAQEGTCWITDDAKVGGGAVVSEDALVKDRAIVNGNAHVAGSALVAQDGFVSGKCTHTQPSASVGMCVSVRKCFNGRHGSSF